MLTTYTCRLYPNRTQTRRLTGYLEVARGIYNRCLEIRRDAWKNDKKSITRFDQTKMLTQWRAEDAAVRDLPVLIGRDAIRRVDLAFQGFFRRAKAKDKKVGYPRFKGTNRYNGFTVTIDPTGNIVKRRGVRVAGVTTPVRHRGLRAFTGRVKQLRLMRRAGKWFAQLLVEDGLTTPPKVPIHKAIGLDMGLTSFVTTSDGMKVEAPKFYRKLEHKLKRAHRVVSRRKKGSRRRGKAVLKLQRLMASINDCREDFAHQLSKLFVSKYDLIAAEKLNVKGMSQGRLAKSILDAAWSGFLWKLSYKAERAGKTYNQVDPSYTSQRCSRCGVIVPKKLSDRVHSCSCGLVLDRDVNAARNILHLSSLNQHPLAVGKRFARGGPVSPSACHSEGGAVETSGPN